VNSELRARAQSPLPGRPARGSRGRAWRPESKRRVTTSWALSRSGLLSRGSLPVAVSKPWLHYQSVRGVVQQTDEPARPGATLAVALIICTLAFGATLSDSASAGKAANGVSWFVNGKPAPVAIRATVGRETGTGVNAYLTITARRKGPGTNRSTDTRASTSAALPGASKAARRPSMTVARSPESTSAT
jgi:hypothetical protein